MKQTAMIGTAVRLRQSLVMLGCALLIATTAGAARQTESTDVATPSDAAAPPSAEPARSLLLQAAVREMPTGPIILRLRRVSLPPGASTLPEPTRGFVFAIVDDGAVEIEVDQPAVIVLAHDRESAPSEVLPAAVATALRVGDQVAFGAGTTWSIRNAEAAPAIILVVDMSSETARDNVAAATPPAIQEERGAIDVGLGEGRIPSLPEGPGAITLERFNLTAGIGLPAYSGPLLLAVESGGFTTVVTTGDVQLSAAGRRGVPPAENPDGQVKVIPGAALIFPTGMEATPPLEGAGGVGLLRLGVLPLDVGVAADEFPVGSTLAVTERDVQLRGGPSLSAEVVAQLNRRQRLTTTGVATTADGRTWYPVQDVRDPSLRGFVAAEFLRLREPRVVPTESV